jgi:hypothetical protein
LYRDTSENTAEDGPECVADYYSENTPTGNLEFPCRKYTMILQED